MRVFSRRLTDVTESLPDIVETIKRNLQADNAIVEGEVIALDAAGYPIAFQHLMRRFKRTREIAGMQEKIPLTLYLFDILFLNGESQISKPYIERREILAKIAGKIPLTNQNVTNQPIQAESYLKEALAAGHEGLMAKKLDSPYTPGRRGKRWLKIKQSLNPSIWSLPPLSMVMAGGRVGCLIIILGARDPESGEFLDIGKTFKGLTDVEIIDLTSAAKRIHHQRGRPPRQGYPQNRCRSRLQRNPAKPQIPKPNGTPIRQNHPNKRRQIARGSQHYWAG